MSRSQSQDPPEIHVWGTLGINTDVVGLVIAEAKKAQTWVKKTTFWNLEGRNDVEEWRERTRESPRAQDDRWGPRGRVATALAQRPRGAQSSEGGRWLERAAHKCPVLITGWILMRRGTFLLGSCCWGYGHRQCECRNYKWHFFFTLKIEYAKK